MKNSIKFTPMLIPTLKGMEHLDNISKNIFPLYCSPYHKGINIFIHKGHVFLEETKQRITNADLLNSLTRIRLISRVANFKVFCTLCTNTPLSEIINLLLNCSFNKLPADCIIYLNDTVIEEHMTKMTAQTRVANVNHMLLHQITDKRVKISPIEYVDDIKSLYKLIEPSLIKDEFCKGVTLMKHGCFYEENVPEKVSVINIDLTKTVDFEVKAVHEKYAFYGKKGNKEEIATSIVVVRNGNIYPIDLDELPLSVAKQIWEERSRVNNNTIKVEVLDTTSFYVPRIKKILKIC